VRSSSFTTPPTVMQHDFLWRTTRDLPERGRIGIFNPSECPSATSPTDVPWYVVPADDKENARLIVSRIVLDTFEGLNMAYPKTTTERHEDLVSIRKQLAQEAPE